MKNDNKQSEEKLEQSQKVKQSEQEQQFEQEREAIMLKADEAKEETFFGSSVKCVDAYHAVHIVLI